ncbi:YceI family protein [Aquimarina sp. MMG016]|uniref:YceI family protein n=1 Tax=Aquimarina sp. MMG016 TaxID=2822690 RepID=UPI001B3A739C|nr:YceI family protein [Aquimarina sp. MMG016]MBQ4820369.1 YceI family protein [Aquimarina sp. MMG016]
MKIKLVSTLAITALVITAFSCKGEKKNETEASAAEEVKEAPAAAITYTIDPASSIIEWIGSKPTEKHTGTIKVSGGSVEVKEDKIESGSFTVDMTSITVTDLEGDEKTSLEGHLKGEGEGKEDHFFNVAKFPNATFELTGVTEKDGKIYLEGNLTIKGIKKNISFPATTTIEGDAMTLNTEVFTINRTDWKVNYASKSIFTDIGDKFINDDIELKITVKANKA